MRTLVWYRGKDLRIADHAPLTAALQAGELITLFVLDPYFFSPAAAQEMPHRIQYLLASLESLRKNIQERGGELLLVSGSSVEVIPRLVRDWRVDQVFAYRWTEPMGRRRDQLVASRLSVPFRLFEGETLLAPGSVRTKAGTPFSVFTPFARAAQMLVTSSKALSAPRQLPKPPAFIDRLTLSSNIPELASLGIVENTKIVTGGEHEARLRLKRFLSKLGGYEQARDQLAEEGTSRLSADLKFGTISVAEVHQKVAAMPQSQSKQRFLSQLMWREFAYACLWDRFELLSVPFKQQFRDFPWARDGEHYTAWERGKTGYPVVDASANQLLKEGYVHNRARMISASFLTKHLLVHYQSGEAHYLKYLTDGDWALNNMGWQWSAGCGVDAQPYFRIFNPITQGQKFDPEGNYVRRYLPELKALPTRYIHAPWTAPPTVLSQAGISLGGSYPLPIVDHSDARKLFLLSAHRHSNQRP